MASKFENTQPIIRELEVTPGKFVKLTIDKTGISVLRKGDKSKNKKPIHHTWCELLAGDGELLWPGMAEENAANVAALAVVDSE
jgi:hypothetical protein